MTTATIATAPKTAPTPTRELVDFDRFLTAVRGAPNLLDYRLYVGVEPTGRDGQGPVGVVITATWEETKPDAPPIPELMNEYIDWHEQHAAKFEAHHDLVGKEP